jgi:hypothetical protein
MAAMVDGDHELEAMYDRLDTMRRRPRCVVVETFAGDVEAAYQAVLDVLRDPP